MLDKAMTMSEVESNFRGEWVLLDNPELDADGWVIGGRVVFHDKDRKKVFEQAKKLEPPRRYTVRYIGAAPEGLDFVL